MMPRQFGDDISNGSGVTVLKDIQTDRQTDKQSHKQTLLKTLSPSLRYAALMVTKTRAAPM